MKELNFYKLPFHRLQGSDRVYDANSNFIFQFESKFTKDGNFVPGLLELQNYVIDSLNNDNKPEKKLDLTFNEDDVNVILLSEKPFITIRGWGNLTGSGAHRMPPDRAAKIQDDLRDYIISKFTE